MYRENAHIKQSKVFTAAHLPEYLLVVSLSAKVKLAGKWYTLFCSKQKEQQSPVNGAFKWDKLTAKKHWNVTNQIFKQWILSVNEHTHMSTTDCQKSEDMMQAEVSVNGSDDTLDTQSLKMKRIYLNYDQDSA